MILTKQKQMALLKLGVVTACVMFALWFFLVHPARTRREQITNGINDLTRKIAAKKHIIARSDETKAQITVSGQKLREIEEMMVTGDIYLWIEKILRDFEIPQQIEFTKYDPPQIVELEVPLKVPYKVALFAVAGTANYHDLGTFLANFENNYPHIRIRRLEVEPILVGRGSKDEKLSFLLEMQVFVRPSSALGSKTGS